MVGKEENPNICISIVVRWKHSSLHLMHVIRRNSAVSKLHPAVKVVLVILVIILLFNIYNRSTPERLIQTNVPQGRIVYEADFGKGKFMIVELPPTNPTLISYTAVYAEPTFGLWRANAWGENWVHHDGSGRIRAMFHTNYPDETLFIIWGGIIDERVQMVRFVGNLNEYDIPVDQVNGLFILMNLDESEIVGIELLNERLSPVYP
jgi:hypothetical protein